MMMSTIEDPRSRFHPSYLPRFDAIVASGVNPQAAASVLTDELEIARIMRNAKPAASVKPAAPKAATPKAAPTPAAPAAKPKAEKPMSAADWLAVEATYRAIEQHHRANAAVIDERAAELDAKFGLAPKANLGVSYNPLTGVQQFNVPVATPAPKQAPRVTQAIPSYVTSMPAPSPTLTRAQRDELESAFAGSRPPADGVSFDPKTGVQQFSVRL